LSRLRVTEVGGGQPFGNARRRLVVPGGAP